MDEGREIRHDEGVARTYATDRIEVTWQPELCTHAGNCYRGLPEAFDPRRRPWVRVDAVDPDTVAAVVVSCPTGALRFRRLDDGPQELDLIGDGTRIRARRDGPIEVRGAVRLTDATRTVHEVTRALLCRCGGSANKPFCDNTHLRIDFRDPED